MTQSVKKYVAELIGTFVLVVFGCGSAVTGGGELGHLGVAFAFGLSLVALAYVIGPISGCHVNPAVSFAMLISRRMSVTDFVGYIVAQVAGAIAGAGLLYAIVDSTGKAVKTLGENGYGDGYGIGITAWMAIVVEVVLTFVFVYAIFGATSNESYSKVSGFVIGLTLTLVHIFGIALTGTSVNPARSLGPALIIGGDALSHVWVFIVAPLVGAIVAAIVYAGLNGRRAKA